MTTLASDDFNRANSGTLGANWTDLSGAAGWSVATNQGKAAAVATLQVSISNTSMATTAHWAQCTLGSLIETDADNGAGPCIRRTGNDMIFMQCSTADIRCYRVASNFSSFTQIGTTGTGCVASDVIYVEAQGNVVVMTRNGSAVCGSPVTDASIPTGTDAGLYCNTSSVLATVDDWSAGDFASGASAALSGSAVSPGSGTQAPGTSVAL